MQYFVGPNGNNTNPGTQDKPWASPQYGVNKSPAGSTVFLLPGEYRLPNYLRIEKKITLKGMPGAKLIAPTDSPSTHGACVTVRGRGVGVVLDGLDISGGYYYCVNTYRGGDDLTIQNCDLHHSGRDCIKIVPGTDNVKILNNKIHHSGVRDTNAEGIDNVACDNMVVRGNHIHDIRTTGLYFKGGAMNCVIEDNVIERCGSGGIYLGFQATDTEWFNRSENPDFEECINGIVRNNLIVGTKMAGIGFYATLNCMAYNNTLVDVAQKSMGGIIYDDSARSVGGVRYPAYNVNPLFVNNIVVVNAAGKRPIVTLRDGAFAKDGVTRIGNNLYYVTGKTGNLVLDNYRLSEVNSVYADPMLDSNYIPQAGSKALTLGFDNGGMIGHKGSGTNLDAFVTNTVKLALTKIPTA